MVDDRDDPEERRNTINDALEATLSPRTESPVTAIGSNQRLSAVVDIATRYRLGDVIGHGGMGEVVLAFDEHIGREVAVKRIRAAQPTNEEIARFVREARVQGRLEHPAIVPVHDIAIDRTGKPFFVMKRLAGTEMTTWLDRLRAGKEPDEPAIRKRLLRAFADVCLAVELAHSRGIVHRDLKPANIMLGDFGEVYVIDWGIARAITDVEVEQRPADDLALDTGETRAGAVLGTPAYMAPEQLLGERAGTAADIYALGCILYEIAAGVPLHAKPRSIADAISAADSTPSARRADSPPELDAICERATAVDAAERFQSARALGAAVQSFLDGDRDVLARKELAQHHIAEARAARARGDGEDDRRIAMRAAGRALALDPTANEAAEIVARLMLAPPNEAPVDVERQLEAIDITTGRSQARIGAFAMTGYLWFIPLLWWTGIRDVRVVAAFAAMALVAAGQIYWMSFRNEIPHRAIYLSAVISAVLIGLVCRLVGPFIIAPTLIVTTLMAYAVHPRFGRMSIVAAILTCGVAVPWLLEVAGVLAPTYHFAKGSLVLTSPNVAFAEAPVQLAFAILLVVQSAITAILLRTMSSKQREVTKQIELQAWHLRQIVPTAS